jgi:hypothetical protein
MAAGNRLFRMNLTKNGHAIPQFCGIQGQTTRNPMLLLALFGLLLFRMDTVQLSALLFQLPPR